jgi:hypothetical protein
VVDCAKRLDTRETDAELLSQFAADGLLRTLAFFDTAARREVKDGAGLRISDFSDEERILAPDHAQSRLPGFSFHVCIFVL